MGGHWGGTTPEAGPVSRLELQATLARRKGIRENTVPTSRRTGRGDGVFYYSMA